MDVHVDVSCVAVNFPCKRKINTWNYFAVIGRDQNL